MNELKTLLPGWRTVRLIGSGGFAKVYEIEKDDESGVKSALKVISIPKSEGEYKLFQDDGYDDESITAIFKSQIDDVVSEFKLMAQLKGTTNIVSYEDHMVVAHEDGRSWDILIRMELLTSLSEHLKTNNLSDEECIQLGIDMCSALELCAKRNILHRDIKPQNIFINDFGSFKLGDFGIAKTMDHTTHATKVGTFNYMSPEVYKGLPYNSTTDIYSLSLVMYWVLNERRLPFLPLPPNNPTSSETNEAQIRRLNGETIPMPKNGSDELKDIILKGLSYDPEDRYASASDMKKALQKLLDDEETLPEEYGWGSLGEDKTGIIFGGYTDARDESTEVEDFDSEEEATEVEGFVGEEEAPEEVDWSNGDKDTEEVHWLEEDEATEVEDFADEDEPTEIEEPFVTDGSGIDRGGTGENFKETNIKIIAVLAAAFLALIIGYFSIHIYSDATCTKPATCAICRKTKGEALGHVWTMATCTEDAYCERCGEKGEAAKGHNWVSADCVIPEKCSRCGEESGEPLGHSWLDATCTDGKRCSKCGMVAGSPLGHNWADATCTTAKKCTRCGELAGDPLGHDWAPATYDSPKKCKRCGKSEGTVKGLVTDIKGSYIQQQDAVMEGYNLSVYELDEPLVSCRWLKMGVTISEPSDSLKNYCIYFRSDGMWSRYWNHEVKEFGVEQIEWLNGEGYTIEAIAIIPDTTNEMSWKTSVRILEAQVNVDD